MEKINIAKLLRDCPTGMELDCTMYENLEFDRIYIDTGVYSIICRVKIEEGGYNVHTFTEYGCYSTEKYSKCVIFPKGKTTWEGFVPPIEFKDGDIVIAEDNGNNESFQLFLLKNLTYSENANNHYGDCYFGWNFQYNELFENGKWWFNRLATEEEKEKLFQAIRENGYKWNPEINTLEKLTESKEDTDDKVVMSGIYFNREDYADEVELHLGNYEIEIRDSRTYAVFKNQETKTLEKLVKPIFKINNIIRHKERKSNTRIVDIKDGNYIFENGDIMPIYLQDNYEFVTDKFDISTLVPFESRVLIRDDEEEKWKPATWGYYDVDHVKGYPYEIVGGNCFCLCIPFENNQHLLGTTNDCDNYYKTWI